MITLKTGITMVFRLQRMVRFWTTKTTHEHVRGSFNEELYKRICEIKFTQNL
jgi:hypothetical protein